MREDNNLLFKKNNILALIAFSSLVMTGCSDPNAAKQKEINQEYLKTKANYDKVAAENEDLQIEIRVREKNIKEANDEKAKFEKKRQEDKP